MSERTWVEGERCMYTRTPSRGHTAGKTVYCAQVWIPSRKRFTHVTLGTSITRAKKLRDKIVGDPDKWIAEREAAKRKAETSGYTVAMLYRDFTANYRGRGGTDYYIDVLKNLVGHFRTTQADMMSPGALDSYLRKRRSEKTKGVTRVIDGKRVMVGAGRQAVGESTLRKECVAVAKMYKWARVRGKVAVNPFLEYETPKEPAPTPAYALSYEQEDRLLAASPSLERDTFAWTLDTGMPRGEVIDLKWSNIDRTHNLIRVNRAKTGKRRDIPLDLSDRISEILARHPQRTDTDLVFHDRGGKPLIGNRLNVVLRAAMQQAGIPKIRGKVWNILRETWSSRIYQQPGVMPQDEADWGGHSMAVATRHYRMYSPEAKERHRGILNRSRKPGATPTETRGISSKETVGAVR